MSNRCKHCGQATEVRGMCPECVEKRFQVIETSDATLRARIEVLTTALRKIEYNCTGSSSLREARIGELARKALEGER